MLSPGNAPDSQGTRSSASGPFGPCGTSARRARPRGTASGAFAALPGAGGFCRACVAPQPHTQHTITLSIPISALAQGASARGRGEARRRPRADGAGRRVGPGAEPPRAAEQQGAASGSRGGRRRRGRQVRGRSETLGSLGRRCRLQRLCLSFQLLSPSCATCTTGPAFKRASNRAYLDVVIVPGRRPPPVALSLGPKFNRSLVLQPSQHHVSAVQCVHFSPDETMLVTQSSDGTAKVWNAATGELLVTVPVYEHTSNVCCFSPCGQLIVSTTADGDGLTLHRASDGSVVSTAADVFRDEDGQTR